MEKIKTDVLKQMFLDGARLIIEKEPYLTEIDSVIGDGDHGEGMKRGCEALIKILETEICNSTTDCRLFLEWGTGD